MSDGGQHATQVLREHSSRSWDQRCQQCSRRDVNSTSPESLTSQNNGNL